MGEGFKAQVGMNVQWVTGDVLWAVPCRFTGSVQGPLQPQSRGYLLSGLEQWSLPRKSPLVMLGVGSEAGPRVSKLQPDHS